MSREFVYEDLSYKIIGAIYEVFNSLGPGLKEKTYQNALCVALKERSIPFETEVYTPQKFHKIVVGKRFFDFLIDKTIIVETKVGNYYAAPHIEQVNEYLRSRALKLAILAYFGSDRVRIKRIVNL